MTGPAIVVLGPGGYDVARRLEKSLKAAEIHGFQPRVPDAGIPFTDTGNHLKNLFRRGTPIIGVCAAGVLIRCLAGVLDEKTDEPPVIAVAEDGRFVVPLLGGHHGANDLARQAAAVLGATVAITTAGDVRFGMALDAPPAGWHLANRGDAKGFTARLLAGEAVRLEGHGPWLEAAALPVSQDAALTIRVTPEAAAGNGETLIYHPACLAMGVGCERGTDPDELTTLVRETLAQAALSPKAVAAIYSLDLKADEPAVHAAAKHLGVTARFFPAARLERESPRLANPSDVVFRAVGCHGVAEGAALAAAGPEGELVAPKFRSARATCAIARAPAPIAVAETGTPQGSLAIIGIGPGTAQWRTPEADALLAAADHIVGYGLYLDLLGPVAAGKRLHPSPIGEEEARARAALDLAAAGATVALVSSGDAGIYAMASLVFQLVEQGNRSDWRRISLAVSPGISALQAAAARAGAPLGHDFCAISLSDLMTPWAVIERRIAAAAEADFVIAFYNPRSGRRTEGMDAAREILLRHRAAETPVVLARNLGRRGERIIVTSLGALCCDDIDMLTLVLIGSSQTRAFAAAGDQTWVYTPRGYGAKTP